MADRKLESVSQAFMLVRASLVGHEELIGTIGTAAFYAHSTEGLKTVVYRAGIRPEGVRPYRGSSVQEPELVGVVDRKPRTRRKVAR